MAAGGVAIGVSLVAATRVPPLCLVLNTCPVLQKVQDEIVFQLAEGTKAQKALEQATNLEQYQRAANQLDAALSKLNTLEPNPEQRRTLEKLQHVASHSREAIAEEKLDQERLLRAEQAIESAKGPSGEGRQAQLDSACRDLQRINGAGFTASRARELGLQLDSLGLRHKQDPVQLHQKIQPVADPPALSLSLKDQFLPHGPLGRRLRAPALLPQGPTPPHHQAPVAAHLCAANRFGSRAHNKMLDV